MSSFTMNWSELSLQVMITFSHFLWQACFVGVALLAAQHVGDSLGDSQIFRRRRGAAKLVNLGETDVSRANMRYTLATLAFFSLPICVAANFAWVHQSRGPIALDASAPAASVTIPVVVESEPTQSVPIAGSPLQPAVESLALTESPVVHTAAAQNLAAFAPSWMKTIQSLAPVLMLAYAIGVTFMLTRFSFSIAASTRLRRTLQPIADARLLHIIAEQASRLGLRRIPVVALCQRVSVPVVVGIVKPMILLPPSLLCGLDPHQLAAILRHEIAHIRRYDLIVNLLQRIVEALLFFHPVTWWISRRVSIERENCCDDLAAAFTGRLSYAGALLQMAELCVGNDGRRMARLASLSADGGNTSELGYRIRRLIGEETTQVGFTWRNLAFGLGLVALLCASLVAWGNMERTEDEQLQDTTVAKIFSPEPLWQTDIVDDGAHFNLLRTSPLVAIEDRVVSVAEDFDLAAGSLMIPPLSRKRDDDRYSTLSLMRRLSSNRDYVVEVSIAQLRNREAEKPGNPTTWKPEKNISFALVGKMDIDGDQTDNGEILQKLIEGFGGRIDAVLDSSTVQSGKLGSGTQYLVLGSDIDDVPVSGDQQERAQAYAAFIKEARDWGTPAISLVKFMSFLKFELRVRRAVDFAQVGSTIKVAPDLDLVNCSVDIENDGDFLVIGDRDDVRVYRTETGKIETTLPVTTKRVDAVAFSPDRQWLVVSDQNDLHFWRWREQGPVKTIHTGRKIDSLVFTPDGQYLAEGPDKHEEIQIREMLTLETVAALKDEVGSPLKVSSMDITPDGRYLVAHNEVSVDQTQIEITHRIHVWDLENRGKPVFQIATSELGLKVVFSDDGRMIVGEFRGATQGGMLAVWKLPAR